MQETIQHFQTLFSTWGYLLLFFYSLGSGYVGIVVAAILSSMGHMDLVKSMVVAGLGNAVGTSLLMLLGRYQKKELRAYLVKHRRKFALVHVWIYKYGLWLIFFNKYLYGVKTIVPLAIGFSKYSLKKFLWLNALACVLWALVLGLLAFYASAWIGALMDRMSGYSYLVPLGFVFLIVALYVWIARLSRKRH
ncbi:Ubiquitous DedA transporter family [Helicobacter bizzozeronii]|uniref:DedA family protein n=1 Tax=Helicobacter bizzozeronii TaxID=56877 RepID=UPI000CEEDD42|nr:DedA family protein [Helicobacter bizzozeronii]GMB93593.1 Ubiquitous DedA transporter family [Helicobacter bizzozeronii]